MEAEHEVVDSHFSGTSTGFRLPGGDIVPLLEDEAIDGDRVVHINCSCGDRCMEPDVYAYHVREQAVALN